MITDIGQYGQFPTKINGLIPDNFEDELSGIESFVIADMNLPENYVNDLQGDELSLFARMLSYFVFFFYCKSTATRVVVPTGETKVVPEHTIHDRHLQIFSWNAGVNIVLKYYRGIIGNMQYFNYIITW